MPVRAAAALLLVAALAGCGSSGDSSSATTAAERLPGAGKPIIRLGTKNFTEQFVLGELYAQALRAQGFRVVLKQNVGGSELIDKVMLAGGIDVYPEYIGVITQELAGQKQRPRSAAETFRRAKAFEEGRDFTLLRRTPGFDADANAVKPAFARRYGLRTTADLAKVGHFRYGGPAENRTRFQGAVGLRQVYGLKRLEFVSLSIPTRYSALDAGKIDVAAVFTTEGQLAERKKYVVLSDPKGIFGFQNIAPVVNRAALRREGPAFTRTMNAVSATLTNKALQDMNGDVDLRRQRPRDIARRFLRAHGLL